MKKCKRCGKINVWERNGVAVSKYCTTCRKIVEAEKKAKHALTKGAIKKRNRVLQNKCDELWKKAVKQKYGNKCIICGSPKVNIHHIVGRRNKSTRWYIPNGCPLCTLHHVFDKDSAHQNPQLFSRLMRESRGEDWEADLLNKANQTWDKDIEKIYNYLLTNLK